MARCFREVHANAASQHRAGQKAQQVLEEARESIGENLGAAVGGAVSDRVLFTSGGTEANNLAVLGLARGRPGAPPGQVIVSAIEHPSVIGPAERLLDEGWRLDTLGVTASGAVRVDQLPPLLTPQTRLVSVMLGNHDTGVLQPVAELAALANNAGVPMHTDAVQVVGKQPVHFRSLGVAAMSVAAHKFQGPAGIGALDCVRAPRSCRCSSAATSSTASAREPSRWPWQSAWLRHSASAAKSSTSGRNECSGYSSRLEEGLRAGYPGIGHQRRGRRTVAANG